MGRPASEWNGRITSSLAKHRNYRLFFLGQLVSLTGTWMQDVALPWLVYHETKSPFAVGLLVFFRFVPFLVLGLFAGVLADRVDNRRLLIATQTISMLLAFILAALAFTDSPPIWAIYAVAILGGAAVVIEGRAARRSSTSSSGATSCRTRLRSTRACSTLPAPSARRSAAS